MLKLRTQLDPLDPAALGAAETTAYGTLDRPNWLSRRDLPKAFGKWHMVHMRFSRWCRKKGVGERVIHTVADDAEIKHVLMDSTIVRAHQHSSGARKKGAQAIGRSRGGLTTNLHMAVVKAGRPLRLIVTEGQASDHAYTNELVEHLRTGAVTADKGYDSKAFVENVRATAAKAVIPSRSNQRPGAVTVECCIELGISSNAFSVASNIFVVSPLVTISSPATISPSLRLPVPLGRW